MSVFDFNVHVVDIMQFDLKLGPEYVNSLSYV